MSMLGPNLGRLSTSLRGEPSHQQSTRGLDDINEQPGLIAVELGSTLGNHQLPELLNWMNSSACCLVEKSLPLWRFKKCGSEFEL